MRHDQRPDQASAVRKPDRPGGRAPADRPGLPDIQRLAGNAAVVQLLRQAGHPWAQETAVQRAPAGTPGGSTAAVQRVRNDKRNNGEGTSGKAAASQGGKRQGDHVFNSLDDTADRVHTRLVAAWDTFFAGVDDDTKKTVAKTLRAEFARVHQQRKDALTALTTAAAAAKEYGHPDKGSEFMSYIATLPEHSTSGSDANSATFGDFSEELKALASACVEGTWAVPADMEAAAREATWPTYLADRIYDADAAGKVLNRRLTVNADKRKFALWETEAKRRYTALFTAIVTAMTTTRAAIVWMRQQNDGPQQPAAAT
ncbi:hypothetical protein ABT034_13330 [Streptomyces sp. NPDC002773]|uniref:hypothetical protein n=1 Tax=Streptomyces sp. NPDC002773 TaxID=3154430 RepID=UPI00331D71A1